MAALHISNRQQHAEVLTTTSTARNASLLRCSHESLSQVGLFVGPKLKTGTNITWQTELPLHHTRTDGMFSLGMAEL